jgi:hypothetical protein
MDLEMVNCWALSVKISTEWVQAVNLVDIWFVNLIGSALSRCFLP